MPFSDFTLFAHDPDNVTYFFGPTVNLAFGGAMAAGDVNGDGYQDLIVGSATQGGVGGYGRTYVLFGGPSFSIEPRILTVPNGTDGFTVQGPSDDKFGQAVASAGDINNDGYDDLMIASTSAAGTVTVLYGKASGFAAQVDVALGSPIPGGLALTGLAPNWSSAVALSSAGDVNGDGYDDMMVGLANYSAAFVVFGGATLPTSINLATLDGTNGFRVTGGAFAGTSVARAGDVNGDGFDDVILGAPYAAGGGAAYVVYGKASGFGANLAVADLDGSNGFTIGGGGTTASAGQDVELAGDVNGDGFDDLIVSDHRYGGYPGHGQVFVVFGQAGGFDADIDLSTLDGTDGFRLAGDGGRALGFRVAGGDINGDGLADLIALGWNGIHDNELNVLFGRSTGFSATETLAGGQGFEVTDGGIAGSWPAVTTADLNGDGLTDILLGQPLAGGYHPNQGAIFVIWGRAIRTGPDGGATMTGSGFDDAMTGGTGDDLLEGLTGDDQLFGGLGLDDLVGGAGSDLLHGGAGADAMAGGAGDDLYVVDDVGDTVAEAGGQGADRVRASVSFTLGANLENLVLDGAGDIDGTGNALANTLDGNSGNNTLSGGDGADLIKGGAGDDVLNGDAGADQLLGGDGEDSLDGADNNDRLEGGDGDDLILGGIGADILDGGADNDVLTAGAGADQLLGGAGTDTLDGGGENDILNGGTGADAMTGGGGDDVFYVDDGGDTTLEALGEGTDTVRAAVTIAALGANIERLILEGAGDIGGTGNALANVMTGNAGANTLSGDGGNDLINGGLGNDTLHGDAGADNLTGGDGDDTLDGGADNDTLTGGVGVDNLTGGTGNDNLDGGADNDSLAGSAGADTLTGGDGDDALDGGADNDVLNGGLGADGATGGTGDDTFYVGDAGDTTVEAAGEGTDTVRAAISWTLGANIERMILEGSSNIDGTGNGLANVLTGNGGNNVLDGGAGLDMLNGGLGADTLIGGMGADNLTGGGGADTFVVRQESVYSSAVPAGRVLEIDTVNDLVAVQSDRLDLSAIDAIAGGADDAFTLVGAFSNTAGQMTLTLAGGNTTLNLDTDGDGKSDYRMTITGDVRADSGGWLL